MARQTHEREDLLRDATALVPRISLRITTEGKPQEVFAGFRKEGALSLYFDDDPVYHFNSASELRRAFVDNRLVKAERGKLVVMQPHRTSKSTDLLRHELTIAEQELFCGAMQERIMWLKAVLLEVSYELVGQVPEDSDGLARLTDWLENFEQVRIAQSPRVG